MSTTTILNVDDTEAARYTKSRVLRHAGFDVVEAGTGNEALLAMERLQPALVMLDVRLPDISGIEVCRVIKQRWPSTMVLQTSATFTSTADRVRGLDGGADAYLVQPMDPDELVAAVRALLRLHAAETATRLLNETLESRIRDRTDELKDANSRLLDQIMQRERAESALMHAQKMEAVGQLTGAIAHDFNNLLAGITGYLHLIQRTTREAPTREYAGKALGAAERGGKLTARLLAFSRAERMQTWATDVREMVLGMTGLARAVGGQHGAGARERAGRTRGGADGRQPARAGAAQPRAQLARRDARGRLGAHRCSRGASRAAGRRTGGGPLRGHRSRRHRPRHAARCRAPCVRPLLHHQAERPRHGAGPPAGARPRAALERHGAAGQPARPGHDRDAVAGRRGRGRDSARRPASTACCTAKANRC